MSPTPSFDALRALHSIIGSALDDIQRVYQGTDFPLLDKPLDRESPSERLASDPSVVDATKKMIAAAGQLVASVQTPTFGIIDAALRVSTLLHYSYRLRHWANSSILVRRTCVSGSL